MESTWGDVSIHRAESGMPLLAADREPAAYFGLGYAQASDDIEGMLRQYLLVRGELSTVEGEQAADRDSNQRRWLVREEAEAALAEMPDELQASYRAFISGVRAWMADNPERVPVWAPPLDAWLPIGVNRTVLLYWVIADAVSALRSAGIPLPAVVSELDRSPLIPASNAWVLAPTRTRDGQTILVSDVHLPFGGVHTLHEATIVTPTLHYTGFTFLGAMLPPLAHNADVAWGITTGGPRVSDAYRVPDTDADSVEINGFRSPIVARHDGFAYALCSPYTGRVAETEQQFNRMLRTRTAGELRATFETGLFAPQNLIAADRHGESFYLRTGLVPRRPEGAVGVLEPTQLWQGFLRQDELVHIDSPASGYLENCNSAPDTVAPELNAVDWSSDAFNDIPGRQNSRSLRSIELLSSATDVDVPEVTAWANEDLWPDTPEWTAGLAAAAAADPARVAGWEPERRALLELLLGFDGHASPDSVAATAWLRWRQRIARTPETRERLRDLIYALDTDLLLGALEEIPTEYQPYGDVHRFPSGAPGRAGAFTIRPGLPDDTRPTEQVPLRATFFADGVAVGGGPALRIVSFGAAGMSSWSLLLPTHAEKFARSEVFPIAFEPADAVLERRLHATETA